MMKSHTRIRKLVREHDSMDAAWSNTLAVLSLATLIGTVVFLAWQR